MAGVNMYDVAIVGGGIVGASIAYWLAPHRRVVLLEGESAHGYHSTGRSAALYAAGYGPAAIRALTRSPRRSSSRSSRRSSPSPCAGCA